MTALNAEAGAISFAHLAGITAPVHAAKADAPEKDDDKEDDKDAAKAEDEDPDTSEEDDKEDKNAAKADADEPDEDDKKDEKKDAKRASVSGVSRGVAQERARWTAVVGSRAFVRNPAIGAHLLANTPMSASAILSALRDAPASASSDGGRSARNPNLGSSAPAVPVTTDTRWGAAFKRAGIIK